MVVGWRKRRRDRRVRLKRRGEGDAKMFGRTLTVPWTKFDPAKGITWTRLFCRDAISVPGISQVVCLIHVHAAKRKRY